MNSRTLKPSGLSSATACGLPVRAQRHRALPRPALLRASLVRASLVLAALLLATLLGGCSKPPANPAASTAAASPYVAVARGKVDIEGGLLQLSMPRSGTLARVLVHEGDHVRQGQLLAMLNAEPATLAVEAARAELAQVQARLQLIGVQRQAAEQRARRLRAAVAAGAGDGQSADDAREAVAQLDDSQAAALASVSMARQKLDAARYALKQCNLLAPFDADVVQVKAQPGASVSPDSGALFTLLPNKPRIVRAELNESYVSAITPGMHAEVLANNGSAAAHWSAHVLRIGEIYGADTLDNDPQVRANARTVECVLGFDQPQQLRIGQRVLVRFSASAPAKD